MKLQNKYLDFYFYDSNESLEKKISVKKPPEKTVQFKINSLYSITYTCTNKCAASLFLKK